MLVIAFTIMTLMPFHTRSLIDVILTTAPQYHSITGVLKYTMSDHYSVYTVINNKLKQDSIPHIFKS